VPFFGKRLHILFAAAGRRQDMSKENRHLKQFVLVSKRLFPD